ncbi:hypothetical protein MASR2M78_13290 [Treponema sp.]
MAILRVRLLDGSEQLIKTNPAISVLNLLVREGIQIPHECGGKALCGTCRVQVLKGRAANPISSREAERLAAIKAGVNERLACQLYAAFDMDIALETHERHKK